MALHPSLNLMSTLTRQLMALNMLKQDLQLESCENLAADETCYAEAFIRLLKQCLDKSRTVLSLSPDMGEYEFSTLVESANLDFDISSKQLFSIYTRLLEFVIDYYVARKKVLGILENQFDDFADKQLDLLQTRSIRAKSQFKTVAEALGPEEFAVFIDQHGLPQSDWGWDILGLNQ